MEKYKLSEELLEKVSEEENKCIGCKLCMKNCPMLTNFCNTPKELLDNIYKEKEVDPNIPYSCALCGYCTQVCPKDVDLKDVFQALRTHIVDTNNTPPKELGYNSVKFHQKNSFSKVFSSGIEGLENGEKRRVFFPGCSLTSYSPDIVMKTYDYLKEKLPGIGIFLKCCGNPTYVMGEAEKFEHYYSTVQEEFEKNDIDEVIVACQNCYKTIGRTSPNIKIVSLWEVIGEYGVPEDKQDYYKSLDKVFTIHDPCPTRKESNIHDSIRNITSQLGLKIKEMKFSREKTLCCGSGGMIGVTSKELSLEQKKKRANQSETENIISYCEECVESMKTGGKKSVHILDLIFDGNIDDAFNQEDIGLIKKWTNRYKGKRKINNINKSSKNIFKYAVVILIIVGISCLLNKLNILKGCGPNEIKDYIRSFGILAPIAYIAILTLLPLLLFPDSVIVIAGGMIFGLVNGTILTSIGSFLGATLSFYISRILGQKIVGKVIKGDGVDLEKYSKKSGFFIILMLRLIPLFPFKIVSYSAGLSNIKFIDFTIATIIGSIPGIIVYTNLGDKSTNVGSGGFYTSIGLLIVLFVISFVLKKKFSVKEIESKDTNED